jgi:hypothetical protein
MIQIFPTSTSPWIAVAVAAAFVVSPLSVQAQECDKLKTYGAYTMCCVAAGRQPMAVSAWVRRHERTAGTARGAGTVAVREADETPGNPLARKPYRDEMTRHDGLRSRAEVLSQSPRMSHYQSRVQELRSEDDRTIKAFELQAGPAGGSAAALPGLKRHDDKLEKMVVQAQGLVDR